MRSHRVPIRLSPRCHFRLVSLRVGRRVGSNPGCVRRLHVGAWGVGVRILRVVIARRSVVGAIHRVGSVIRVGGRLGVWMLDRRGPLLLILVRIRSIIIRLLRAYSGHSRGIAVSPGVEVGGRGRLIGSRWRLVRVPSSSGIVVVVVFEWLTRTCHICFGRSG